MGDIGLLVDGFATALQPQYLLFALIGVVLGTAVGVLPGIGPAMTVALLLPLTYTLEPEASLIMFAGIYYGGMYGGSTTSILLNTPGEASSVITTIDGNAMARAGRGAAALATAAIGSLVAGTIATVALTLLAPTIADLAVRLGPQDYVALMVVAFLTVAALLGDSPARGLASLAIGLFLGLIGTDTHQSAAVHLRRAGAGRRDRRRRGRSRRVRDRGGAVRRVADAQRPDPDHGGGPRLDDPRGLAAVEEALAAGNRDRLPDRHHPRRRGRRRDVPVVLGRATPVAARRRVRQGGDRRRRRAGGANNAAAAGVLVPLLTLGLPTSATAAIIIAAFQSYGIRPGPLLFQNESALVWALIASLYVGNVLLLVLNLPLVKIWVKLLQIPRPYLYAGILTFAALGSYSVNASTVDLLLLLALGVLGWVMRRFGYPIAPAIVGLILGPVAEEQLRRTLAISQGDPTALVSSPFAIAVYVSLLLLLAVGIVVKRREARVEEELLGERATAEEPR